MLNFWQQQKKPIFALAPLAGISDSAFRQICLWEGADLVYSEMASATALVYAPAKTLELVSASSGEKPYVVQLFGSDPAHFALAAKLLSTKKINDRLPDGLDINFGCPVPKVAKQKAGAELFKDLKKSKAVIKAVIINTHLPVSIKTRIQAGETDILNFLESISDLDIKAIMIHGRTLKQGFKGPIDCEIIKKARNYFGGIILANGGIYDYQQANEVLEKSQADGLGIARGALGNPWLFKELKKQKNIKKTFEKTKVMALKHAELAYELKGDRGIIEMRKHLCWYTQGLPEAKKLREKLVEVKTLNDIKAIFRLQ